MSASAGCGSGARAVWADRYQAAHDSLAEYVKNDDSMTDPEERAKQFQAEKAKMRAIMAGDAQERVAQIRELQRTDNLSSDPRDSTAIVDALTKLADLRVRGALTDAEFQAQKQKLLGG
jgi:succinate dehydrogenase/fumarate reductase flavoprotein subunit